ncbi:MAG: HD domain-containing protein [Chlorobiaceae bacterium]|nr:HD domain-containing protein [Chlorobiaceae bacterium]
MSVMKSDLIDNLFDGYRDVLGPDYDAYRNHCLRVFNFCLRLTRGKPVAEEKIAIAAFFHDIGIWTDKTLDYIVPSQEHAAAYLKKSGKAEWIDEITAMIGEHHKLSAYKENPEWLVEAFRKSDMVDLSGGMIRFKMSDKFFNDVLEEFPYEGFHKMLLQLLVERLKTRPFNLLPMVKL